MTDNEIIKALECCVNDTCEECPYGEDECFADLNEENKMLKDTLDLINRQKAEIEKKNTEIDVLIRKKDTLRDEISELRAEIERLNIRNKALTAITKNYDWKFAKAKSEAIKEVINRLERKMQWQTYGDYRLVRSYLASIVKEMTEQKE